MIHLQSVSLSRIPPAEVDQFPFTVPVIRALPDITFTTPVTFLVGENGSGKSTFLEAIASAANSIAVGSDELDRDTSLANVRKLGKALKLTWSKRTRNGFFLRAEDYFGYAKRLARIRQELEQEVREIDEEYKDRSAYAQGLARMAHIGQLHALRTQYNGDLDERSHGESFFTFFKARFNPNGLYLLDEPEAPLSPLRQLAFLSLLKEMVEQHNAQFIIATHSPILMAYPGATILSFDRSPVTSVAYDDLEHVSLTRDFLNNREIFLRQL
ncbi:MAG: AAA family ATPase [Anaerolineaceae bacterium]|nr:AAA family ATPase [Anaerolineaceae bacterium]